MVPTINGKPTSVYKIANANAKQTRIDNSGIAGYTLRVDLMLTDPKSINIIPGNGDIIKLDKPQKGSTVIEKEDRADDVVYYQSWKK